MILVLNFLKNKHFNLDKFADDGRINSAVNEANIIELLSQKFDILKAKKRDWFDFCYQSSENFYPINLKITELSTDNLNCKLGIYYALTGKMPNFDNQISWENFLENLSKNIQKNNKDYYFLIINKNDLNDIFWTSLKNINILTPNGNNLPFQANWQINKIKIYRHYDEVREILLTTFGKSLKLRARAYNQFLEFFPDFKDKI